MFALLILSLVILTNGNFITKREDLKPESNYTSKEGQCIPKCDELFSKSVTALPKSDVWFSCYRGCRLSALVSKTDDKTKKRITNTCDKVCSEIYNKTMLEKACQMGCSFEETTVVSKKTPPQTKTPAKIYKKQIPAPKKVNIPITKDDKTKMIPMSFPMMPWTLRFFDRKSEVIEDGESKETPSQDSFGQQIPDLMSLSRDPFGLLTRLFKNPILLPDPDSVKITKSTVTVYGTEDGGNDVEILKSDSSNPGVIERTFFSQPIDFIEGDSTSGKKSASPSTEKIEMSAPKPTMHLPETSEQTVPINSIKMSYEKKLTGKVTSEMEKPQGEILGFLVFVFVFMSILLIMTKYQSKKDNLYFPLPLNKDNEKSSSLFEDEDDDDEDELVKLIKRVGKLERQDVSLISSSPPSYEETQKTPVLKVSLDATASSNEDRFSKLAEKC